MAEDLHDDTLIDALGEQQSGRGVSGVVYPSVTNTGRFEQGLPFVPVSMVTDRPAVALAPDKIGVFPGWPAVIRSASCAVRCALSAAPSWAGRAIVRLLLSDFGSVRRSPPPVRFGHVRA